MIIENIKNYSFSEIRSMYKAYLQKQNLASTTINTSCGDTFYLWRKGSAELFWSVVTSNDFAIEAKNALNRALQENSKGNTSSNINNYMYHLRRFCVFLRTDCDMETHIIKKSFSTIQHKKQNEKILPTPSKELVQEYLLKWKMKENYQLQESALNKLFFELSPKNCNIEDILLKAATLNDFYSTNIFCIYSIAKHIYDLNIDTRLKAGDITLVSDIGLVTISGVQKYFYSFATKYCSHHNPLDYPIYDRYVDEVLRYFRKEDRFSDFMDADLKQYVRFKAILIDFRKYYGLEKYNLKQIDQYLWQLGKEYFPKNYYLHKRTRKTLGIK